MVFEEPDRQKRDFMYRFNPISNFAQRLGVGLIQLITFVLILKDAQRNILEVGIVDGVKAFAETLNLSQSVQNN